MTSDEIKYSTGTYRVVAGRTSFLVEKRCDCGCWATVEGCDGYSSTDKAMAEGLRILQNYHQTTAYSLATCWHNNV